METLALPGRKTGRFLRMGMSKTLDVFESDSRYINSFYQVLHPNLYSDICFFNFLNVEDFIRYKLPQLLVKATYNLLTVEIGIPFIEKSLLSSESNFSVKITQAALTVSPLEYDQFNAGNE